MAGQTSGGSRPHSQKPRDARLEPRKTNPQGAPQPLDDGRQAASPGQNQSIPIDKLDAANDK